MSYIMPTGLGADPTSMPATGVSRLNLSAPAPAGSSWLDKLLGVGQGVLQVYGETKVAQQQARAAASQAAAARAAAQAAASQSFLPAAMQKMPGWVWPLAIGGVGLVVFMAMGKRKK